MRPDLVYLVQTDTTVGFLSCDARRLAALKERPSSKPFLIALPDFRALEEVGRIPPRHRNFVRRSVKRSFVLPNGLSFRVVTGEHRHFVARFGWCYTTSANRHGEPFDEAYAREACDVVVESKEGFSDKTPSTIWRLGRRRKVRIR
jgi:tRNA A37 threonylcarbamoyladenosine synthetase subunit TsaC/SUA5/YrdC